MAKNSKSITWGGVPVFLRAAMPFRCNTMVARWVDDLTYEVSSLRTDHSGCEPVWGEAFNLGDGTMIREQVGPVQHTACKTVEVGVAVLKRASTNHRLRPVFLRPGKYINAWDDITQAEARMRARIIEVYGDDK